jgi:hypothetical protein
MAEEREVLEGVVAEDNAKVVTMPTEPVEPVAPRPVDELCKVLKDALAAGTTILVKWGKYESTVEAVTIIEPTEVEAYQGKKPLLAIAAAV